MKFIDITKINEDFNEIALAKFDIENVWKTTNINLYDFLNRLKIINSFIYSNNEIINFSYIKGFKDNYIFYNGHIDNKLNEHFIDILSKLLAKSNFNLISILNEIKIEDLVLNEKTSPDYPYFLIDRKYYIFKE